MRRTMLIFALLITAGFLANASPSGALPPQQPDRWEFGAAIYGWLPSINGDLGFPLVGEDKPFTIDTGTILDDLKMTAQFGLEMQKNNWSVLADIIYLDMGSKKTGSATLPRGHTFSAEMNVDMKSWIVDFDGAYTIWKNERSRTQFLFGIRYLWLESSLDVSTSADFLGGAHLKADTDVLDAIIGLRGHFGIGGSWSIPYRVDLGTGGSEFTWKGQAGIDYGWRWGGLMLMYRYLYFDEGDDKVMQKMYMPGPLLGFRFHF